MSIPLFFLSIYVSFVQIPAFFHYSKKVCIVAYIQRNHIHIYTYIKRFRLICTNSPNNNISITNCGPRESKIPIYKASTSMNGGLCEVHRPIRRACLLVAGQSLILVQIMTSKIHKSLESLKLHYNNKHIVQLMYNKVQFCLSVIILIIWVLQKQFECLRMRISVFFFN